MEPEVDQINKEYETFQTDVEFLARELFKSWTESRNSEELLKLYAVKSIEAAKIFFTTMNELLPPVREDPK